MTLHPPQLESLSGFDDDELLSMGQSNLVMSFDHDCDESIYLQAPGVLSPEGYEYRALALYNVGRNELGFPVSWPEPVKR